MTCSFDSLRARIVTALRRSRSEPVVGIELALVTRLNLVCGAYTVAVAGWNNGDRLRAPGVGCFERSRGLPLDAGSIDCMAAISSLDNRPRESFFVEPSQ